MWAAIVYAQGPFPLFIPPNDIAGTTVVLANRGNPAPISCQIRNPGSPYAGQLIAFEFGPDPQDGRTLITAGQPPRIRLNRGSLSQRPEAVQVFLIAHECGHANLYPDMSEVDANCYAAQRIRSVYGPDFVPNGWQAVYEALTTAFPFPVGPYPSGVDQMRLMQPPYCQ